jgi:manganese/iron transport system permease protein
VLRRLLIQPFEAPFMLRALGEVALLSVLGGVVGVHVVLRRMAFLAEALQHTVFPGIVVAFLLGESVLLGAAASAAVTITLLALLARRPAIDADAALALLVGAFFAFGVVLVSRRSGYQHDLTALLFGRVLAVDGRQLIETALVAATCLLVLAALHKELVLQAFDPIGTAALGYPSLALDLVLNAAVALAVVAAVQALGTVLVLAFIVTPAAAARLMCRGVGAMMVVAVTLAAVSGWIGLAASYEASVHHGVRLAAGASTVVTITVAFLVVVAGRGLVAAVGARSTPP